MQAGNTALHLAAAQGDVLVARELLRCGASPLRVNLVGGLSPTYACQGDGGLMRSWTVSWDPADL
jgi:ankyrin repeat protein